MRLLTRWLVTAAAVTVTVWLLPGIHTLGTRSQATIAVLVFAAVLGLVNAFVRPILAFLACGCIIATLGIFMLIINGFTFWLASWFCFNLLHVGFYVDSYWTAFWAALVVSFVSYVISMFLPDDTYQDSEY